MLYPDRPSLIFYKAEITATRLSIYFPRKCYRTPRTVKPITGARNNCHKATPQRKFFVFHSYKLESVWDEMTVLLNENLGYPWFVFFTFVFHCSSYLHHSFPQAWSFYSQCENVCDLCVLFSFENITFSNSHTEPHTPVCGSLCANLCEFCT